MSVVLWAKKAKEDIQDHLVIKVLVVIKENVEKKVKSVKKDFQDIED